MHTGVVDGLDEATVAFLEEFAPDRKGQQRVGLRAPVIRYKEPVDTAVEMFAEIGDVVKKGDKLLAGITEIARMNKDL